MIRLEIPAAEWLDVCQRVAPFVHPDERLAHGHVLLSTIGGHRRWCAVDQWRITMLEGGPESAEVTAAVPSRLIEAAVILAGEDGEHDAVLEVHTDDDGEVAALLTLRVGETVIDMGAGPAGLPDVDEITTKRLAANSVAVQVARQALYDLVRIGRRAPLGAVSDDQGPDSEDLSPLFWMEVEAGELALTVDWEEYGEWRLAIPCRADGPSKVPVGPLFLAEYLECHEGDEELTLLLPADRRTYLVVQSGPWSGFLLPVDRTAEAHRSRLEDQLQRIGLGPLVSDHDGDYAFRFGTSEIFVRLVEDEPPRARIFAIVLSEVEESPDLLRELNSINASPYLARAFLTEDQVMVGWELIAETMDDDELRLTCEEVVRLAAGTGPFLASLFGGRTAYAEEDDTADDTDEDTDDDVQLP